MKKLVKTNVDRYLTEMDSWRKTPSKQDIVDCLVEYHDLEKAEEAADDLLSSGEAYMNDSSCTVYTLL